MKLVLASKAGKLPVVDSTRAAMLDNVLPTLLSEENRQEFYQGKGENLTLGQDTFNVELQNDDGTPAGRVMFSWSVNIWGPKVAGETTKGKGAKGTPEDDRITLLPKELVALDAAIAMMKEHNDIDGAVKLATIKGIAEQQGGKVSRDQHHIVYSLANHQ